MGDFNCPYPNDREQIENLFIKYGMIQHVHQPSHIQCGTLDLLSVPQHSQKLNILASLGGECTSVLIIQLLTLFTL